MSQTTASRTVLVTNRAGLHLRAGYMIAKAVQKLRARVELVRGHHRVEATDVMQILSLGAECGAELILEATGPEAEAALDAVVKLFSENFGEE